MLSPSYSSQTDLRLTEAEGRAKIVWFIDYADLRSRRVRDILRRSSERFGAQNASIAIRFAPQEHEGKDAALAAKAAIAAFAQSERGDIFERLFEHNGAYDRADILEMAEAAGLDIARFTRDLDSPETQAKLEADLASYAASGRPQLPVFFVDGRQFEGSWDETSIIEAIQRPLGLRLRLASDQFFHWAASAGLVLVLATLAALVVTNIGFHAAYEHLKHTPLGLSFGEWSFALPLEAWVNDGLMALFFLLVGIEIKREIVDGELSTLDKAMLPIVAALGGMMVPALIFTAVNWGQPTAHGWGVPMATDIAFTLGLMAMLGSRVPTSLKVFVSALAIADDLGAIVVIALFYGHGFHLHDFLMALGVLGVMAAMNIGRIYARTPYMILFAFLWFFIHESGLHATLAGVLTAAAIPSRRSADLEGTALRAEGVIVEELERTHGQSIGDSAFRRLQAAVEGLREPGFHLQHGLENWSNFLILPLFAFFNTGILLFGSSFSPTAPESLGVILGLVLGKPLGILLSVWLAIRLGLARLSAEIRWGQLLGAGFLCGVGFTMSIFIGSAAFEGAQLEAVKLSVLMASVLSATIGMICLVLFGRRS